MTMGRQLQPWTCWFQLPGIGELIGGSQREERLEYLEARLDDLKLNKDAFWWYLDLRHYGSVPHAGFGLGFERLGQFATGMDKYKGCYSFSSNTWLC
ncbi:PREDICTED: asparagine--tRNA ligase, chloroplastic/mitochondrial-like [Lupinus angustifolius]|uniref:asparagine--tRNA ligase, chloroplastic/mitochondrial-like n=1 Tax=Lupinus angustifolius TaxID=3871 RepID=UPI00092FACE6|nr:PREDICTED: asparagine--tRNA ligase, chloroplastic/mitochondrial-like [Lupinus angustifolius]